MFLCQDTLSQLSSLPWPAGSLWALIFLIPTFNDVKNITCLPHAPSLADLSVNHQWSGELKQALQEGVWMHQGRKWKHAGRKGCSHCHLLVAGYEAMCCPGIPWLSYTAQPANEELWLKCEKGVKSKHGQINQARPLLGMVTWGSVTDSTTGRTSTCRQAVHCTTLGEGVACTTQTSQVYTFTTMFQQNQYIVTIFWHMEVKHSEDRHLFLKHIKLPHCGNSNPGHWLWLRWATCFVCIGLCLQRTSSSGINVFPRIAQ